MAACLRAGLAVRPGRDPFGVSTAHPGVQRTLSPVLAEPGERSSPLFYLWGSRLPHLQPGVQPETRGHPRTGFWGFLSGSLCVLLPHIPATSVSLLSDTSPELSGTSVPAWWVPLPDATTRRGPSGENRSSRGAASSPVAQRPTLCAAPRSVSLTVMSHACPVS